MMRSLLDEQHLAAWHLKRELNRGGSSTATDLKVNPKGDNKEDENEKKTSRE